jgi:hypothetical protein
MTEQNPAMQNNVRLRICALPSVVHIKYRLNINTINNRTDTILSTIKRFFMAYSF